MTLDTSKTAVPGTSRVRAFAANPFTGIIGLFVVLVILGFTLTRQDWLLQGAMAISLAIAAVGLSLALGLAGEFLLGIALIFAASAYTTAVFIQVLKWGFIPSMVAGIVAATIVGILVSLPGLRISHFYFGMIGFFTVYLIPTLVQLASGVTNGSNGLSISSAPDFFGAMLDGNGMFVLAAVALLIALLFARNVRESPLGVHMRRMRDGQHVLATSGVPVWRIRFAVYVLTAVLAGLGGAVYSDLSGFLSPDIFNFDMTNLIVAAVIIGGSRTLMGPVIGVIVLYIVPRVVINVEGYSDIVYGVIIVVSVILFRGGIAQAVRDLIAWIAKRRAGGVVLEPEQLTVAREPEALAELLVGLRGELTSHELTVRGIRKNYGGVRALDFEDEQSVTVRTGEVHLLLGPNGSGKTTLLNAMCGLARVDVGSVSLDGQEISRLPLATIARKGISRSFQGPTLPDEVTPIDLFAASLAQMRHVSYFHWLLSDLKAVRTRRQTRAEAAKIADATGLGTAAYQACVGLTSGQRRIVDVVLALISRSSIVLLDEPAAGLSDAERKQLASTVRALAARGLGVILVEHDLDLALSIADRVTVMASGRPLAAGDPQEVTQTAIVREVLIGAQA